MFRWLDRRRQVSYSNFLVLSLQPLPKQKKYLPVINKISESVPLSTPVTLSAGAPIFLCPADVSEFVIAVAVLDSDPFYRLGIICIKVDGSVPLSKNH